MSDDCACTEDETCIAHTPKTKEELEKSAKELRVFAESNAMNLLGITADQLKIAKALNRQAIKMIKSFCEHHSDSTHSFSRREILRRLPTFEDKNEKET